MTSDLGEIVDTDRYPIHRQGSAGWQAAVTDARRELADDGCAVLRGFIPPRHLELLRAEGAGLAPYAHYETASVNVYNTAVHEISPELPAEHPSRVVLQRGNAFVARDHIPDDLLIARIYRDSGVHAMLAACIGAPALHQLADPLAGLCLNVVPPGRAHPWHFDTNEVAISLLTSEPESGGRFEYCPGIRSAGTENLADVAGVLADRRDDLIRRRTLRPGDLQIFHGRYSLHRVTEVTGATARHSAIFSFSTRPGVVGTVERTRQLFGRVLPEHGAGTVRVDDLLS